MLGLLCLAKEALCDRYAFLLAGSNTYRNYRHQSDVFQMYTILKDRGLKNDHKILMAYDDIASSSENPRRGHVYNIRKNIDIYPGSEAIDYSGSDVNPEKVKLALTGTSGKVLKSGSKDDVFIYYNDHGAPGFLCFPPGAGQLTGQGLADIVKGMVDNKKFGRLFIVIEACFSGSVAKLIENYKNVICITAASDSQSSYSYGYDYAVRSFRTNEFSHNFFNYILSHPEATIQQVYEYTKIHTFGSDVQLYGDKSLASLPVSTFLFEADPIRAEFENAEFIHGNATHSAMTTQMAYYKERAADKSISDKERILLLARRHAEAKRRGISKRVMEKIAAPFIDDNDANLYEFDEVNVLWKCYEETVEAFRTNCGELDEFEYKRLSMFSHLCDITQDSKPIVARIKEVCPVKKWRLINID